MTFSYKNYAFKSWQVLILLVLTAAFIRFYKLEYSGLWLDEIYSMNGANPDSKIIDVYNYGRGDQPPLSFILLHYWLKLFGYTDFAGRALSCVYGIIGIVAIYFLGREMKNERLGLFVAFVTTINWFHVVYSKEIRFYSLIFLLSTLSVLFLIRALKHERVRDFIFYTLFTALLLNTHYFGMAVYIAQIIIFITILVFFKFTKKLLVGGLIAGAIAGLSFAHWLNVIFSELGVGKNWLPPLEWDFLFDLAWSYVREPTAFAIFIVCVCLSLIKFYERIKSRTVNLVDVVLIIWIGVGIGLPTLYSFLKVPILNSKYTSIVVPGVFIVIANGFTLIKNKKVVLALISLITIAGLIILFYARPPHKPRRSEDWREVASFFKGTNDENKVIFSSVAWFHRYYFTKLNIGSPVDQNSCDFASEISKVDSVWLLYNDWYAPKSSSDFLPDQKEIMNRIFSRKDSITFKQTTALLYVRNENDR